VSGAPVPPRGRAERPKGLGESMSGGAKSEAVVSGGLLRIYGLGVLIIGESGVGKSETALELVVRGHRFVSDDVIHVRRDARGRLIGRAPRLSRFFMEIRGLGIIHIRETFGPRAIALESPIELVIRLKRWQRKKEFDRLGLRFPEDHIILGERIPQVNLPVAPGRNIATLIEVAARVHWLKLRGFHAAEILSRRLDRALSAGRKEIRAG
jgi:HPr kinase/phosphorylase